MRSQYENPTVELMDLDCSDIIMLSNGDEKDNENTTEEGGEE